MACKNKNINLDRRLLRCASLVREGASAVDVGTDHAYLAIHLIKSERASRVIACDLREGPLNNALTNIKKYGCEADIETRLSNGLEAVAPGEADDIIIAGMGGEVIAEIINKACWLKNSKKHLILQPMTMAEHLRRFLFKEGFKIIEESAVTAGTKVYTVMLAKFSGKSFEVGQLYPYIGELLNNLDDAALEYIRREIKDLDNRILGHRCEGNFSDEEKLEAVKQELEILIEECK